MSSRGASRLEYMIRKEVQFWPDQLRWLRDAAFDLRLEHRGKGGDTITESSLVRVAVDLYITQWGHVSAAAENDLRAAVGLPARDDHGRVQDAPSPTGLGRLLPQEPDLSEPASSRPEAGSSRRRPGSW